MKKRLLALILCLPLALSGCASMLERGHETLSTHIDYSVTEDDSVLRTESYQGLVNAMLYFVGGHRAEGTIRLYNYTGDVEADLMNARNEVLERDAIGAFSVRSLDYEATRILTYYEVELRLGYSRTAREVEGLREVMGLAGVRQELDRLVAGQESSTAFLASYFSGDRELVEQLLLLACMGAPELCRHHGMDGADISLYPEAGTRRVVEVTLRWPGGAAAAAREENEYAQQLETAAAALLEANPPAGESYAVEELAAIVRASAAPEEDGSGRALDALNGEPASDFGLLMAMEYLCRQCAVEVEPVSGSPGLWLIVSTADGYRHLLPRGLYPAGGEEEAGEDSAPPEKLLYTDQELLELGYEWDGSLYPACEDYGEDQPQPGT